MPRAFAAGIASRSTKSLVVTLTLWYALILAVLVGAAGVFVYRSFEGRLLREVDDSLREVGGDIWRDWGSTHGRTWAQAIDAGERRHEMLSPTVLVVALDARGLPDAARTVGSGTRPFRDLLLDRAAYANAERKDDQGYLLTLRRPNRPAAVRVGLFDMHGPYVFQVAVSLGPTEARLRQLAWVLGIGGAVLLGLASLGGMFIVRRALRPVQDVVRAARALSADDLSLRIPGADRSDEIGDLVATFNEMLDRLETSVGRIKQFTADVSHELRSPVTVIRGEIEVGLRRQRTPEEYRETLETVLDEAGRMGGLIDDLLLLSRLDATKAAVQESTVQLDEVLLRVFERRESLARAKPVALEVCQADPTPLRGDDRLLERLVSNLVDNAIRYTPAGGRIELGVTQEGDRALLRVRDSGMGIPAEAIPRLFERFYVVDPSRSRETGGAGLGLSIVKTIADLHGATIRVESVVGEGSLFEVSFVAIPSRLGA